MDSKLTVSQFLDTEGMFFIDATLSEIVQTLENNIYPVTCYLIIVIIFFVLIDLSSVCTNFADTLIDLR